MLRAARAALKLTHAEIALRAGISHRTVYAIESGGNVQFNSVEALQRALEGLGVEFIHTERGSGIIIRDNMKVPPC